MVIFFSHGQHIEILMTATALQCCITCEQVHSGEEMKTGLIYS